MAPDGIVEPVNIAAHGLGSLLTGVEDGPPHKLGYQSLEERLHHGVVVTVALCRHRSGRRACGARLDNRPNSIGCHGRSDGSARLLDGAIARALRRAASARSRCSRSPVAQPTTRRASRSAHKRTKHECGLGKHLSENLTERQISNHFFNSLLGRLVPAVTGWHAYTIEADDDITTKLIGEPVIAWLFPLGSSEPLPITLWGYRINPLRALWSFKSRAAGK